MILGPLVLIRVIHPRDKLLNIWVRDQVIPLELVQLINQRLEHVEESMNILWSEAHDLAELLLGEALFGEAKAEDEGLDLVLLERLGAGDYVGFDDLGEGGCGWDG